jgi:hypothetical protein
MRQNLFSRKWLKANAGPSVKVEEFKAGDHEGISAGGWYYRVDEPGRKGEWLGPYKTENSARAEASAEVSED